MVTNQSSMESMGLMIIHIGDILFRNKYYLIINKIQSYYISVILKKKERQLLLQNNTNSLKQVLNKKIVVLQDITNFQKVETLSPILKKFLIYDQVQSIAQNYFDDFHRSKGKRTSVHYAGRLFDFKEITNVMISGLDFWLTNGRFERQFTENFKKFIGSKYVLTTNSGSSANLLAISALTSYKLKQKQLKSGDEVITVAATFPTTLAPIIQNNLIPVFVDMHIPSYNINIKQIEKVITPKTKAIFIPHTLGLPFDIYRIKKICDKYNLWFIEDNCDALGCKYNGKFTGTFGDIATFSFYPAHHMTMGEGGAVVTDNYELYKILLSFRDWGRDCWCASGKDNTCGLRFSQQLGKLPLGYDHKYTYSHLGYNLKITEMQASIGLEQLNKLPKFIKKRKENWLFFKQFFDKYSQFFYNTVIPPKVDLSPFGFIITIKPNSPFTRKNFVDFIEKKGIQTRMLFGGNILKQPVLTSNPIKVRILNSKLLISSNLTDSNYKALPNTNLIMNNTFWIGVWPGLTSVQKKYMIKIFQLFLNQYV